MVTGNSKGQVCYAGPSHAIKGRVNYMRSYCFSAFVLFVFLYATPAFAQPAEDVSAPTPAAPLAVTATPGASIRPAEQVNTTPPLVEVDDFANLDLAALLDSRVETASKKSESISQAPAMIEVLTRKQLLDLGARDLYTALSYLPGIELIETFGGNPTLVFRGVMQEQYNIKSLMLINGHPVHDPVNSLFKLELIPIEAISRIEVIRGPGSVLYGNNAYSGVINVITVAAQEEGANVTTRAEGGQFTTFMGGAGTYGRQGDLSWSVHANATNTRGYPLRIHKLQNAECLPTSAVPPATPYYCSRPGDLSKTIEYYNNYQNGYGELKYAGLRFQAGGYNQKRQKFGMLPILRYEGHNESQHVFADLSYTAQWGDLTITPRIGFDTDDRLSNIGTPSPVTKLPARLVTNNGRIIRADLSTTWAPLDWVNIDQGLGVEQSSSDGPAIYQGKGNDVFTGYELYDKAPRQLMVSYYGQGTIRPVESISLLAGVRVSSFQTDERDIHNTSSSTPVYKIVPGEQMLNASPRGGVVYSPREDTTFKLLYGEAFRVPNLWETTMALKTVQGPTLGIKPETIRTVDLGVDNRSIEWLSVRANAFYSALENQIARRLAFGEEAKFFGFVYDNTQRTRTYGTEFGINAIASEDWTFFANVTWKKVNVEYIQARYAYPAGFFRLVNPAPVTANLGTSYQAASWLVARPNAQYVGARGYAKSYVLANAVADFPITPNITLSAIANNLTDAQYEYPEYILRATKTIPGGPGRAFYGRITASY